MAKLITAVRIKEERAEILKEKAMDLTVKSKEYIKEADIVNFLIDEFAERVNVDQNGLFVDEEEKEEIKPQKKR